MSLAIPLAKYGKSGIDTMKIWGMRLGLVESRIHGAQSPWRIETAVSESAVQPGTKTEYLAED